MKFGMFLIGDNDPGLKRGLKDYYEAMIEQVKASEKLGYECFWFGEHHFDFFGVIPSPPIIMSLAAKTTEKIRLGVAVSLLPFRNPILTAEEYAMVDVLSGGRLDFGVGRGTPDEMVGFKVDADTRELFGESLEVVEMAWREGKVTFEGNHHRFNDIPLNVVPVQKPLPPVFLACLSRPSYEFAGGKGYPILGIPYASCKNLEEVRSKNNLYKDKLDASGFFPGNFDIVQCFHTHVAESNNEAQKRAKEPMNRYYSQRFHVRPRNYDELYEDRMIIIGDPKHCINQIEEIRDTGTNYIIFMMNFASMEQKNILNSMELMAKEVIPKFRDD